MRVDSWHIGRVGFKERDRDQRQSYVAHFLEHTVKGGLVGGRAIDDGGAVAAAHMTGAGLSITVLVNARAAAVPGGRARWPGGREV